MDDVLGYEGKSVMVTGAASGMGQAAAQILVDLGATVTALDIKPTNVPVTRALHIDLRDRANIEQVAASIEGPSTASSAAPDCRGRRSASGTPSW